jgi:hypothetical protein
MLVYVRISYANVHYVRGLVMEGQNSLSMSSVSLL